MPVAARWSPRDYSLFAATVAVFGLAHLGVGLGWAIDSSRDGSMSPSLRTVRDVGKHFGWMGGSPLRPWGVVMLLAAVLILLGIWRAPWVAQLGLGLGAVITGAIGAGVAVDYVHVGTVTIFGVVWSGLALVALQLILGVGATLIRRR